MQRVSMQKKQTAFRHTWLIFQHAIGAELKATMNIAGLDHWVDPRVRRAVCDALLHYLALVNVSFQPATMSYQASYQLNWTH
jgi:hypothetical protein